MSIQTHRLTLSFIQQDDLQDVFDTMNFKHTAQTISFMAWPMTMEQAQAWCDKSVLGAEKKTDYLYIARDNEQRPVGCIGLHSFKTDVLEIGYWVSELHQGKGYASEMLTGVIDYAFRILNLQALYATVIPDNLKSLKLLQKNGFEITGKVDKPVAAAGKVSERYTTQLQNPAKA